jgi:hypothetical protein
MDRLKAFTGKRVVLLKISAGFLTAAGFAEISDLSKQVLRADCKVAGRYSCPHESSQTLPDR